MWILSLWMILIVFTSPIILIVGIVLTAITIAIVEAFERYQNND